MTSPIEFVNPLLWATLTVNGTGFGFASVSKTNGSTTTSNTRLVLPEGVNIVTVDWSGKSRVVIQAGTSGLIRKVEIPAAESGTPRQVTLRVPVSTSDAFVNVTTYKNAASEVGEAVGGIVVYPSDLLTT